MVAYIYARVSTMDQYVNGYSIDQQVRTCVEYAQRSGLVLGIATNCDLPGVIIDGGRSAYRKPLVTRPGGLLLMQTLKPGDTVVTLATHRLFRRLSDMVAVMDKWTTDGVSVKFVDYPMLSTDTANGRAMMYITAVMAQLKSELISARVKESKQIRSEVPARTAKIIERYVEEPCGKDLGSIMQGVMRDREEAAKYKFTGTLRIYVRVSTKDQTVDHQVELIKKTMATEFQGAPIAWYVDEGSSAFKTPMRKRPSGGQLLKDLQAGDMVVAWRPDRIFRSLIDASKVVDQVHKAGASLMTIEGGIRTDTPHGRAMMHMLSLFAEIESQDISRMVKLGRFGAVGENPAARKHALPKFLRKPKAHHTQKFYAFHNVFTQDERFHMHIEYYLTHKHYRSQAAACRAISNKWLRRAGLPPMGNEFGDTVRMYRKKLKTMQKEHATSRRAKVLSSLDNFEDEVRYPLNPTTILKVSKRQEEFLAVAKRFPGRLRDKEALTVMIKGCVAQDDAVDFVKRVMS